MSRKYYFISSVIGAELAFMFIILTSIVGKKYSSYTLILTGLSVILAVIFICIILQKLKFLFIKMVIYQYRKSEKAAKFCRESISDTDDIIIKSKLYILLAGLYIKENDFSQAQRAIKKVNPKINSKRFNIMYSLSDRYKLEYYLTSAYIEIVLNNLILASEMLENGKWYINKYKNNRKFRYNIFRIAGMLEYAKGNYMDAQEFLSEAINSTKDIEKSLEASFILAKVYLNTNRYELYSGLMKEIIAKSSSSSLVQSAKASLARNG